MARYGRDYGDRGGREPGWVDTFREGWGFGAASHEGYDRDYRGGRVGREDLYGRINRGGRSRFGGGYGGSERGEGWRGPDRGYDRDAGRRGSTARGGSTGWGERGGWGSRYGSGNRTGYNRFGGGGPERGYDRYW